MLIINQNTIQNVVKYKKFPSIETIKIRYFAG